MYLDQPGLMELWDRIKAVFAPKSHTHDYAGSSSPGGAAASAAKLSTPRNIVLSDAVDSIAQPFDGSKNVSIPVYSLKESYLDWGGKSIAGLVSPIGCALSAERSANRLAFIDGGAVSIEYSSDGGATWTDYGFSANYKSQLFTKSVGIPIGRTVSSEEYTASSATRVTISAEGKVYTKPRKMLMNISTSSTLSLTVETRTGEDGAAWKEYGTYTISGWSGWNDIPLVLFTFGGLPSQTTNIKHLRLTIRATRVGSNKKECQLLAIRLFGDTDWLSASYASGKGPMSSTGHLYDFDMAANATFPAGVKASSFTGQLNGSIATKDGVNASLEKLPTWTATPTDSTQLVRRDTANTATYGRVTFLTVWNYIKGKADALYAAKSHTHQASDVSGVVADVRMNGTSITADGVANIPLTSYKAPGVCSVGTGLLLNASTGAIRVQDPSTTYVNQRKSSQAVTCNMLDYAVKAAMCDGHGAAWTATEQAAARKRLGVTEGGTGGGTASFSRIWFSRQAPGHDMETDGYFGFKMAFLACSESLNPTDNVQAGDTILWNGYAYFVEDTDGSEAVGATRFEFAPHKA